MLYLIKHGLLILLFLHSVSQSAGKDYLYKENANNSELFYYFMHYTDTSGIAFEILNTTYQITYYKIGIFTKNKTNLTVSFISEPFGNVKISSITLPNTSIDSVIKYSMSYDIFTEYYTGLLILNMDSINYNTISLFIKPVFEKTDIPIRPDVSITEGRLVTLNNFTRFSYSKQFLKSSIPYYIVTQPYSLFLDQYQIINPIQNLSFQAKSGVSELFMYEYFALPSHYKGFVAEYQNTNPDVKHPINFKIVNQRIINIENIEYQQVISYPNRIKQFIKPFKKNRNALFDFYFN